MSQQEQEERPPVKPEDQSEGEDQAKAEAKVNTHQLFLKVKESRKQRRRKTFSGYEEYNLKHIRIQIEQEQIQLLQQIKALADSLIEKKRELLLDGDGVVV